MARTPKPTPFSLGIVQAFKTAIADKRGVENATLSHRIPIRTPGVPAPVIYTIEITHDPGGTYLATCSEMPQVLTTAATEEEALMRARVNIFNLLRRPARPKPRA